MANVKYVGAGDRAYFAVPLTIIFLPFSLKVLPVLKRRKDWPPKYVGGSEENFTNVEVNNVL